MILAFGIEIYFSAHLPAVHLASGKLVALLNSVFKRRGMQRLQLSNRRLIEHLARQCLMIWRDTTRLRQMIVLQDSTQAPDITAGEWFQKLTLLLS